MANISPVDALAVLSEGTTAPIVLPVITETSKMRLDDAETYAYSCP